MTHFRFGSVSDYASRLLRLARLTIGRLEEDRCFEVAASLTFTTLLALVPLITIALAIFSAFPAFASLTAQIKTFILANLVPDASSKVITVYMRQFSDNAARLTALGVLGLAIAAVLLMLTIEGTFNKVWRARRSRPLGYRVVLYWSVLTIGPLLVGGSLSLTSWLVALSDDVGRVAPGIQGLVLKLVPFVMTWLGLAFVYTTVPNRPVAWRDALAGGAIASLGFELGKSWFAGYISHFTTYQLVYGTFASVPVFLVWVYVSWLIVLVGAVVAAVLPDWHAGARPGRPREGHRLYQALAILRELALSHRGGQAISLAALQHTAGVAYGDAEALLADLAQAGWAKETVDGGWLLARDPRQIELGDLYRRYVFAPGEIGVPAALAGVQHLLARVEAGAERELAVHLDELFAAPVEHGVPAATADAGPLTERS